MGTPLVASERPALRPMRVNRTGSRGGSDSSVPVMPEPVSPRPVAPDWSSPTEGNGLAQPRGKLHVALLAPDAETARVWRQRARIVTPPLWKGGKVQLHVVIHDAARQPDAAVLLAMVDLGLIDSADAGLIGYPSGLENE